MKLEDDDIFVGDTTIENTLQEVLTYIHGIGLIQGTYKNHQEFISLVAGFPLYQLFNTNVVARIENEIISKSSTRDLVLTLYTQFMTTLNLRGHDFTVEKIIKMLEKSYISSFNISVYLQDSNKTLIKNLSNSILPIKKNYPSEYLASNEWYIMVVLINVFSISLIKIMDEIKRPYG